MLDMCVVEFQKKNLCVVEKILKKIMHIYVEAESTFDQCSSDVCFEWEKTKKKKFKNVMHRSKSGG